MNYISSSMQAYALDLSLIEIQVSKEYYQGTVETMYIRENKEMTRLEITKDREDAHFCYYRASYSLDITKIYDIISGYGLSVVLQYQKLIHMPTFDSQFYYEHEDLGATYQTFQTTWKVWAPTALQVHLLLQVKDKKVSYEMEKNTKGIFSITIVGDYDSAVYTYLVNHGTKYVECLDPYSYSSTSNAKGSVVINLERCLSDTYKTMLPKLKKKSDAIIYETSIRDFTIDSLLYCKNPGKYLGFIETGLQTAEGNCAGLDYVKSLGVTHIQMMPMQDFSTVEENHPDAIYNWGYDPIQYSVPEGSYSTKPDNPYTRIVECQHMIARLHQHELRVVLDVVYNHMYDTQQSAFENLVPGYFFRRNEDGSLSNGSWCGNEVNTSAKMVRKYLIDMSLRWVKLYGIDGIRLDLMGLIDIQTLNEIYNVCSQEDPDFLMYGEGWNMETLIPFDKRGVQDNHHRMPYIGFFNDTFRDTLKGSSSDNHLEDRGYFSGNMFKTELLSQYLMNHQRYSAVSQSINYVECHDNATIFDKYSLSNKEDTEDVRRQRQKLLTMTTILAQGIPFLHSGQEWYRTKKGDTNSYCSGDHINKIHWSMVDKYQRDIADIRKVIKIRREHSGFWYDTNSEVQQNIKIEIYDHQMIKYIAHQREGLYRTLYIYINGSNQKYKIDIQQPYDVLYNDTNLQEIVEIPSLSMVILGVR